jgi:multicomponent Na+:H+ antiporter subunit C
MDILLSVIVGLLFAAGIYLMLHRSYVKLVIGLGIVGHAANLFIFCISRLTRGEPALIAEGATAPEPPFGDPLPQALILTAIVIGFGIQAFAVVLFRRAYQATGEHDMGQLNNTDCIDAP